VSFCTSSAKIAAMLAAATPTFVVASALAAGTATFPASVALELLGDSTPIAWLLRRVAPSVQRVQLLSGRFRRVDRVLLGVDEEVERLFHRFAVVQTVVRGLVVDELPEISIDLLGSECRWVPILSRLLDGVDVRTLGAQIVD
jgi:hypothetical protein